MENPRKRIELIDALRGLAVVLMVVHHLFYDMVEFLDAPQWLYTNPLFDFLHYVFAGLFIFISGVSSRFSRGNIRRGLIALAFAAGISAVTYYMDMPIWFGVIHLLAFSMLFFGLTRSIWDMIPRKIVSAIFISLIVASSLAISHVEPIAENWMSNILLSLLGWRQLGFESYDYFPLLPWIFVFLLGTWAGIYIVERRLPTWFYDAEFPILPAIGRKSLLIYVLHQPILYGLVMVIRPLIL